MKLPAHIRWAKWEAGICTKCGGKVERRNKGAESAGSKQWYYTTTWYCVDCRTVFLDERYKVVVDRADPTGDPTNQ